MAEENASPSEVDRFATFDRATVEAENEGNAGATLNRQKRTLLLKKKLLGAGLLGFGLGAVKGYKAAYYSAPQVRHVYLSPPPASSVKYVEYVEKPIFIERIVERPSPIVKPIHAEYKDPSPYGYIFCSFSSTYVLCQ
ncbi:hypothetical protein WH47_06840 [Habropoda laboriosa]|uniref:Uncharacterized protein n=1 Tax=Habropoda laboriosa TaxID=597456 RepID=A0A0L7RIW0_9HYME|nr:hypothetical protein WH47_06840 [Habropoda laboriosa]